MVHQQGHTNDDNFWMFTVINFADYLVKFWNSISIKMITPHN